MDGAGGRPSYKRGVYFSGSGKAKLTVPEFLLHHACSFHFWTLLLSTETD
jgi:hypothetical protein